MKLLSSSLFASIWSLSLALPQNEQQQQSQKQPQPQQPQPPQQPQQQAQIHVLIYETEGISLRGKQSDTPLTPAESLVQQVNRLEGFEAQQFGDGQRFEGYGSKFSAVLPILDDLPDDAIVVISDSRDVLINNPQFDDKYVKTYVHEVKQAFEELTADHPDAIIISAEAQCCVSALTHVAPGSYYTMQGSRAARACSSGMAGCLWNGDDMALPWQTFMQDLMKERTSTTDNTQEQQEVQDLYLNAGLIAGKAKDLIRVIDSAQIGNEEDDQAVLTDYLYHNRDDIVLDYHQRLFGNNRGGLANMKNGGCVFAKDTTENNTDTNSRLVHSKTQTTPLFLHSPGGFYQCHDRMAFQLGQELVTKELRTALKKKDRKLGCNYKRGKCDQEDLPDEEEEDDGRGGILSRLRDRVQDNNEDDDNGGGGLFGGGAGGANDGLFDRDRNGLFSGNLRDNLRNGNGLFGQRGD